jgi:hypothetical protein
VAFYLEYAFIKVAAVVLFAAPFSKI